MPAERRIGSRALLAALLAVSSVAVLAPSAVAAGDGSLARTGARAIGDPRGVAVSPGGGNVYVTSARSDAVAVFRRNRATGALRRLRGRGARGLGNPSDVVVSGDGRNVYVASDGSDLIAVFRRNRRTGALRPLRSFPVFSIPDPSSLELSLDGHFLYANSAIGVVGFRRVVRTGRIRMFIPNGPHPAAAGLAVDPGGDFLYGSSPGDMRVAVYGLSAGAPRWVDGAAGCISEGGAGGCTTGRTLNGVSGLAMSPDGRQLYAAAEFRGAVAILARDPMTGALSQPAGPLGCIRDGGGLDCAEARFMGHPDLIEMSRDGLNLYVRAEGSDIVALRRDPATGGLSQVGTTKDLEATAIALSRDGKNVYVASARRGGGILVYSRAR